MRRYAAFLRAINVAGHSVLKMSDLRQAFSAAGCLRVESFIQSGNIVFEADPGESSRIFTQTRREVARLTGEEPVIMFRTWEELEDIVGSNPFREFGQDARIKLYVAFLAQAPDPRPPLPLSNPKEALDLISISGAHAFLLSRRKANGLYAFPNLFVEKELGVAATTRNWSTLQRMIRALS